MAGDADKQAAKRRAQVADASVFPTSIHVNPQLTIMAMAGLAWEHGIAEAT